MQRPLAPAPGAVAPEITHEPAHLLGARIMAVDDQAMNLELLGLILHGAGYTDIRYVTDPRTVVDEYQLYQPDLVLLDLHMPHLDGVQVMELLAPHIGSEYVPILVLTGDPTFEAKQRALSVGAKDFVTKPFSRGEVLLRIRNLLETRFLYMQLQRHNHELEGKVRDRTQELEETQIEILERLSIAAEYRDDTTGQHAQRVGEYSARIARELGLPNNEVELIRRAALLHDVGKIGIPDHILLKNGRFTADERQQMAQHTVIGARIVSGSRSPLLRLAEQVALTHHDHWDGGPNGNASGEAIPLAGRIVAVADVFDALTHERPYKTAWSVADASAEIERQRARQFDPNVVDAFLAILKSVECAEDLLRTAA